MVNFWAAQAPRATFTTASRGADDSILGLNQGCTAHKHIDKMHIVHKNGRIYDPRLGRFMKAHTLIEADATQGLNRYTYVLNNPLTHTDPSGHSIAKYGRQIAAIAISIAAPYAATAVWGTLSRTASFWVSVGTGFLSGAVASGDLKGGLWAFSAGFVYDTNIFIGFVDVAKLVRCARGTSNREWPK